ncbi:uncharacterized protein [Coffea arabica]|uniref:VQ domain-containing protein n=1 Tax=Coffea arabica TaxID=13443 RepID=A0A6P6UQY5_COFAR|nr:uncharacterized protein LOC113713401 [Coffea arabica]
MDSGNSGSMQSSSGGDEEYESRSESISSFLNPSAHFGSISDHPQASVPQLLPHQPTSTLFNPHSQNSLDAFPQSLLANNPSGGNTNTTSTQYGSNHDLVWPRGLRSEANYANFGNVTASSSAQSVLAGGVQGLNSQSPSMLPSLGIEATKNDAKASLLQTADQQQPANVVKNPKKRTRASRRAPTTVLTTDTTNFRQMVQEFTGIPTAPFSAAASPFSRRLDLFSTVATSNLRAAGHLADSLGSLYPLRPSAQKMVQLSPFGTSSNTMIDALVSSTTTNAAGNIPNIPSAGGGNSSNTVLPPDHLGLPKQPQNLLNMQNQMLSIQPLLLNKHQPSVTLATKNQGNTSHVPSFDELGLGHHPDHHQNVNANLSGWKDGGGTLNASQENLGGSSQHISNYKFNCSASTSEFQHDKGLENVTSAGEGTVGSWICPSD